MSKPISLTKLCSECDLSLNAASILKALIKSGVLREVEYKSTTGSGSVKTFKEILPAYESIGINSPTVHPFRTEPKFYSSTFPDLIALVVKQLEIELGGVK